MRCTGWGQLVFALNARRASVLQRFELTTLLQASLTKHSAPSSLPFYAPYLPSRRLMLMQYELPAGTEKAMQIVCTRLWRELHGRNASRGVDVRDVAGKYVMFTRGAVRGALVALGVGAAVHADWTKDFPGVRFRVQLDQTMFSGAV